MKPGRPAAHVTIAGRRLSAAEAGLASMTVDIGMFSHDRVTLRLWPRSKFAGAGRGAAMSVELGTEDDERDVWTGTVSQASSLPDRVVLEGLAPTAALSAERKSQTYVDQGAADIVRDLASSVDIDQIDSTQRLEAYSVDARRTVWAHLVDLALLAGAEISASPAGGLRFVEVRPGPASRTLRYKADLLWWDLRSAAAMPPPAYAAHGAASEAGKDKWHWIFQQTASKPSHIVGGFHARAAADALNKAAEVRSESATTQGRIRLVGHAALRAGEAIALEDVPGGDPPPLRVLSLTHRLDGAAGFVTDVAVAGAGGGLGL